LHLPGHVASAGPGQSLAGTLAVARPEVEHQRVLPDPDCYEERDRLTGRDGMGLAAGLLAIGLGLLWHPQAIFLVIGAASWAWTVRRPRTSGGQ
jgi:hypothetical protein